MRDLVNVMETNEEGALGEESSRSRTGMTEVL